MHWCALCEYIPQAAHMRSGHDFCVWLMDRQAKHLTGHTVTGVLRRIDPGLVPWRALVMSSTSFPAVIVVIRQSLSVSSHTLKKKHGIAHILVFFLPPTQVA